jgi:hypothetical protein
VRFRERHGRSRQSRSHGERIDEVGGIVGVGYVTPGPADAEQARHCSRGEPRKSEGATVGDASAALPLAVVLLQQGATDRVVP